MRKIKFRGISTHSGEWVYGNFIHSKRFAACGNEFRIHNQETGLESDIIPETVGQFTGLWDKNGREIYEGDILHVNKPYTYLKGKDIHIIKWQETDSAFGYFNVRTNFFDTDRTGHLIKIGSNKHGSWCEIIGNIHDNPELL